MGLIFLPYHSLEVRLLQLSMFGSMRDTTSVSPAVTSLLSSCVTHNDNTLHLHCLHTQGYEPSHRSDRRLSSQSNCALLSQTSSHRLHNLIIFKKLVTDMETRSGGTGTVDFLNVLVSIQALQTHRHTHRHDEWQKSHKAWHSESMCSVHVHLKES